MQQHSPSDFSHGQDDIDQCCAAYCSRWNHSVSSFTDVHREAYYWRHRLAAVLDAAERGLCWPSNADTRDTGIYSEIADTLDAFLNIRNSAAGWQDMHSADAELMRRGLCAFAEHVGCHDPGPISRHQ